MNYERHPLSALFGDITDDELSELAMDIKNNGQFTPGTICDGLILDGWHRYLACQIAGCKFKADTLKKDVDPVAFVISRNVFRRHLTALQRTSIVIKCHEWKKPGNQQSKSVSATESSTPKPAPGAGLSEKELAALAGASERTVRIAKKAEREGLGDAVRAGEVTKEDIVPRVTQRKPTPPIDAGYAQKILELEATVEEHTTTIASLEEMLTDYETLKQENDTMTKVLAESHDKQMPAALAEIKRLNEFVRVLEERICGLQGERNMAIKAAKRANK